MPDGSSITGIFDPGNPAYELSRNQQIRGNKYILIHNINYPDGGAIDAIDPSDITRITAHHAGGRRHRSRRSHRSHRSRKTPRF